MIIGVPKEVKIDEYRVAMTPAGVEELLWELADGRVPIAVDARPPTQTATLRVMPRLTKENAAGD